MPRSRLGVALLVPPPFDREIDGLRRGCGDGSLGRIPPHITLVPPVNVRDDERGDALAVLRAAAAPAAPLELTLGPVRTFAPVTPVLYLAVGGAAVPALHALRDRVFVPPLSRPLTHPFVPHVTIADDAPADRLEAAVRALAEWSADVVVDRVHLLEEQGDRIWRPVGDAALEATRVVARGGLPLELAVTERPDPEALTFAEREAALAGPRATATARTPMAVTARRDGTVVGLATGWTQGGRAWLDGVVVATGHRSEGIGSHLLAAVVDAAHRRGCDEIAVDVVAGGEAFYRDRGWSEETRVPGPAGGSRVRLRRRL
jgi:2'-5' RNA ligase